MPVVHVQLMNYKNKTMESIWMIWDLMGFLLIVGFILNTVFFVWLIRKGTQSSKILKELKIISRELTLSRKIKQE